jgi:CRP-like cAMP-binding protein
MGGGRPEIRTLRPGDTLTNEGEPGNELFLLLDGVLIAKVGGREVAEVGPGAILGERAILEGGTRTATLRAVTPAKVAVAPADRLDRAALAEVSTGHRREEG